MIFVIFLMIVSGNSESDVNVQEERHYVAETVASTPSASDTGVKEKLKSK